MPTHQYIHGCGTHTVRVYHSRQYASRSLDPAWRYTTTLPLNTFLPTHLPCWYKPFFANDGIGVAQPLWIRLPKNLHDSVPTKWMMYILSISNQQPSSDQPSSNNHVFVPQYFPHSPIATVRVWGPKFTLIRIDNRLMCVRNSLHPWYQRILTPYANEEEYSLYILPYTISGQALHA